MTVCNVKEVTRSNEPTDNYRPTLQFPFSSMEHFSVFQLIRPATLLFWFTRTALFSIVPRHIGQLFSHW